ncbi:MAG: FAD-dependent oxidoreductase, partial [Burkholderiaceae bacterium]
MNTHVDPFDVLVVGSGLAGLTTALELANGGRRVAIITKRSADTGATAWAQGGIAAVLGANDDFSPHA